jgi:hypothetical protein
MGIFSNRFRKNVTSVGRAGVRSAEGQHPLTHCLFPVCPSHSSENTLCLGLQLCSNTAPSKCGTAYTVVCWPLAPVLQQHPKWNKEREAGPGLTVGSVFP